MYTKSFIKLTDAYNWAINYIQENPSLKFALNPICEDTFKSARPKGRNSRIFELFGTTWGIQTTVQNIEPNGMWNVEVHDYHGSKYFLLWYNRFLPYAKAMAFCENGFEQPGIDYQSILGIYGTVCGYTDLGNGNYTTSENDPNYERIYGDDVNVFQNIYEISMKLKSPTLPFDEAFQPCLSYLFLYKPRLVKKHFSSSYIMNHIQQVVSDLKHRK